MKKTWFTALLLVGAYMLAQVTSAPTTPTPSNSSNHKPVAVALTAQPDSKKAAADDGKKKAAPSKNEAAASDDVNVRKKKSEEFIQFGNQQNKPAGMVDDALSGIATKKNLDMKRQQGYDDGMSPVEDEESGSEADQLSLLMGNDDKGEPLRQDYAGFVNDGDSESESFLGANGLGAAIPMDNQLQEDNQSPFRALREQNADRLNGEWFGRDDFANRRKRRNILRNDRNFRKRSLRTTTEKLMNMRGGAARWKRDARSHEDDLLGFLSLLAAAELVKEKEEKEREFNERFGDSEGLPWLRFGYPEDDSSIDNIGLSPENYGYYYYPGQPLDLDVLSRVADNKESPEMMVFNPDEMATIKRSFYPAVDYRSLGIIGARKRRRQHQPLPLGDFDDEFEEGPHSVGNWGRIRGNVGHRNEPSLNQILGEYSSMEDESDNQDSAENTGNSESSNSYGGHRSDSEKLYSLGELLNGKSEVEDYRYPLYRRLI